MTRPDPRSGGSGVFSATQGCHQNGMRKGVEEGVDVSVDVVVVGGGAIGLASAWRLSQAGLSVTVCDPAPGSQATHASAGMLAPVTEAHYGEDRLLRLNLAAAERWPAFAAELEAESGLPVGYRTCGSLLVALDADDARVLEDLAGYLARLDLDAELLSGSASREVEPSLAPGVRRGLRVAGDHQADNRLLADALLAALDRRGATVVEQAVDRIDVVDGAVAGVTLADGSTVAVDRAVLAAGCWSGRDRRPPRRRRAAGAPGEGPDPAHPGPRRPARPTRATCGAWSAADRSTSCRGPAAASSWEPRSRNRASTRP